MILSDDEVRAADEYGGGYNMPTIKDLAKSHVEANSRIRALEAKLRELVKTIDRLDKRKEEGSQILAKLIAYGPGTSPEGDKWIKTNRANVVNLRNAEAAYQAALTAAREE